MSSELIPLAKRWAEQQAEHERRMREDPEYAAEQARRDAEGLAEQERRRRWEATAERERIARRRRESGIGERMWEDLDAPEPWDPLEVVREFLADERLTFLVLLGGLGVGKTFAAAWAVDQHGGALVKVASLLDERFESERWKRVRNAALLALDDYGVRRDTKGHLDGIFGELVDLRYDHRRKTIITSNLPGSAPDDDPRALTFIAACNAADGGRVIDRLRETGRIYTVPGDSRRRPVNARPGERP